MMDIETLKMLGDSLDRLLKRLDLPSAALDNTGLSPEVRKELCDNLAEFGILGLFLSEEKGGFDNDLSALAEVMRKLGEHLASEPFLSSAVVSAKLLSSLGCDSLVEEIATNQMTCTVAHWETSDQSEQYPLQCEATLESDGWRINGSKEFVYEALNATHLIVSASLEKESKIGLFLVPADSPSITQKNFNLIDKTSASNVMFEATEVSEDALLGKLPADSELIQDALDTGAIAVCAETIGVLTTMVNSTRDYIKQRKQFGKPLSDFQTLQHRLAEMTCELKLAESMLSILINQPQDELRVSAAKYRIGRASKSIRHSAVQLHGGIGTTDELALTHFFRRAYVIERSYGSTQTQMNRYKALRENHGEHHAAAT